MNPETDGYNGEQAGNSLECGTGERVEWRCSKCKRETGVIIASFGYQYDVEPDDETMPRIQDFFDAFVLTHVCDKATKPVRMAVLECA